MSTRKKIPAAVLALMLGLAPILSLPAQAADATASLEKTSSELTEHHADRAATDQEQGKEARKEEVKANLVSTSELKDKLNKTLDYYTLAKESQFSPPEKESLKEAAKVIEEEITGGSRTDLEAHKDTVKKLAGEQKYATLVAYRELLNGMTEGVPDEYEKISNGDAAKETAEEHKAASVTDNKDSKENKADLKEKREASETKEGQASQGIKEGTIVLTRTDKEGFVIKGAEITVWDKDNKEVFKGVTDDKGRVYFSPDQSGTYTYQETKPAQGYAKDDKKYQVSIDPDFNVSGETTTATEATKSDQQEVVGQTGNTGTPTSGSSGGLFSSGENVPQTGLTDKAKVFGVISAILIALSGLSYTIYQKYAKRNICRGLRF
ncbi:SpaA isopeptide-forming pilin-related protein [Peptococcus simiae]|uniref:SpaA isopeptide-forming pilin-related protein n=1 Tax=Peptococcus simiae TaxID=1643805 RepID=UPI00397EA40A